MFINKTNFHVKIYIYLFFILTLRDPIYRKTIHPRDIYQSFDRFQEGLNLTV